MKPVIIIGASGHGKVVADIIQESGDKVIGFLDDNPKLPNTFVGCPVLGVVEEYKNFVDKAEFVIAIGNAFIREKIADKLSKAKWYTAIHPAAVISSLDVSIAEGTVVMANAVINPGSTIGKHCIINSGAVVEHDNIIEDFVHVSIGAKLAGTVHIGKATWIGVGSVVSNNISVCAECMIGAGAVVVNNIENIGIYVGVPAFRLEKKDIC
ncbi:acetyltransferase [Anaerocolumna aminovalerica]|uniref:acetyltransferase n=1 Tax=Anaerocolumna aminovalerica TaxID=1527 RepID=UPI00248D2AD9|nr:acetyltransferase [Anaerocolumna aminovalerica]